MRAMNASARLHEAKFGRQPAALCIELFEVRRIACPIPIGGKAKRLGQRVASRHENAHLFIGPHHA